MEIGVLVDIAIATVALGNVFHRICSSLDVCVTIVSYETYNSAKIYLIFLLLASAGWGWFVF